MDIEKFLQQDKIKALIAEDNLEEVYENCNREELSTYLLNKGINPVEYFKDSIPDSAFFYCKNLTDAVIPNGVTTIGGHAFYGCTDLINLIIPDSVTRIDQYAFARCNSLINVTIGTGMIVIGQHAFRNCTSLTDITYNSTRDQWKKIRKNQGWRTGSLINTIHCLDGDISLKS